MQASNRLGQCTSSPGCLPGKLQLQWLRVSSASLRCASDMSSLRQARPSIYSGVPTFHWTCGWSAGQPSSGISRGSRTMTYLKFPPVGRASLSYTRLAIALPSGSVAVVSVKLTGTGQSTPPPSPKRRNPQPVTMYA